MSTLDVAQLAAPSVGSGLGAIGGAGVERTVDEEVGAIGAELRRMVTPGTLVNVGCVWTTP